MSTAGGSGVRARLAEITQRAEAATPGPWLQEPDTGAGKVWVQRGHRHHGQDCEPLFAFRDLRTSAFDREAMQANYAQRERDAEFVAMARTDVPALLAVAAVVLERHQPVPVFDLCNHADDSAGQVAEHAWETDEGEWVCGPQIATACSSCRDTDGSLIPFPCSEYSDVVEALGVSE